MESIAPESTYQCWLWIELIGFDNTRQDFGVAALLDNTGFVPESVSLLLFNPDFVHLHSGMEQDLPYDCCSYAGHPRNEERGRQDWTNLQLTGLVQELQKHGIAVYFAVFDMYVTEEWIAQHPEILHIRKDGQRLNSVCPWKRFNDGTYYEDFYVEQLVRVMRDYGFDGYHGADGYGHPRIAIYDGDFSDDMVEQFVQAAQVVLPVECGPGCNDNPSHLQQRADSIWRHHRREWIEFYTDRTTRFWKKVVEALHAEGKKVVLNSAWTRDPFEAKYRYAMDYRRLMDAGVDGFIVEAAAAASETEREESSAKVLRDFMAMLLLIKAYVPEVPLYFLHGVKDTREQWNVLRHAPTSLERETHSLANLFSQDAEGNLHRCSSGLVVCLADDIRQHEWEWLQRLWELAFAGRPRTAVGATLVWSDRAHENQMDNFLDTRGPTTHRLLHSLISSGAPLCSAVNVRHLANTTGAMLVLNPHLYPEDELRALREYRKGPLVLVGPKIDLARKPDLQFEDPCSHDPAWCSVYGLQAPPVGVRIELNAEVEESPAPEEISEPSTFLRDLYFRQVSAGFLRACTEVLVACSQGVKILRPSESVQTMAFEMDAGQLRLFLGNDRHSYVTASVDVGRGIADIEVLSPFPLFPVTPTGSTFSVKIPGRGMVVVGVRVRDRDGCVSTVSNCDDKARDCCMEGPLATVGGKA